MHAGLIPEAGYLSDDEDLSQVCETDVEAGTEMMLGEDWISWRARHEAHITYLRNAWMVQQQAVRDAWGREQAYLRFQNAIHPPQLSPDLPWNERYFTEDHHTDLEAADELPLGAEAHNINNDHISEADCP